MEAIGGFSKDFTGKIERKKAYKTELKKQTRIIEKYQSKLKAYQVIAEEYDRILAENGIVLSKNATLIRQAKYIGKVNALRFYLPKMQDISGKFKEIMKEILLSEKRDDFSPENEYSLNTIISAFIKENQIFIKKLDAKMIVLESLCESRNSMIKAIELQREIEFSHTLNLLAIRIYNASLNMLIGYQSYCN